MTDTCDNTLFRVTSINENIDEDDDLKKGSSVDINMENKVSKETSNVIPSLKELAALPKVQMLSSSSISFVSEFNQKQKEAQLQNKKKPVIPALEKAKRRKEIEDRKKAAREQQKKKNKILLEKRRQQKKNEKLKPKGIKKVKRGLIGSKITNSLGMLECNKQSIASTSSSISNKSIKEKTKKPNILIENNNKINKKSISKPPLSPNMKGKMNESQKNDKNEKKDINKMIIFEKKKSREPTTVEDVEKNGNLFLEEECYPLSDYDSEYSDDDMEEQENDKPKPRWAKQHHLLDIVNRQSQIDPEAIFGKTINKTCNLVEIFKGYPVKPRWKKRSNSGDWTRDNIGWQEDINYKIAMGWGSK